MRSATRTAAWLGVLMWLGATLAPALDDQVNRRAARGKEAMVVSEHPLATAAGVEILRAGGNAVDAACGVAFALSVVYPVAGNLGGGGFLLYRDAAGETHSIDFRERAPAAATRDMYLDEKGDFMRQRATVGHLAAGVPGSVAGLFQAHERLGKLSWKHVVEPAIRLAREGFEVDPLLADGLAGAARQFRRFEGSREQFLPDGATPEAGATLRLPDLARTLELIAQHGAKGFYTGPVADLIVAEMERGGGLISHEDLAGYRAVWREPLRRSYRGHEIISMGPPSSGGPLLLQMLGVLEHWNLKELGAGSAASTHLLAQAMAHAYADRAEHLGDPDYYAVPTKWLFAQKRVEEIARAIDPEKHTRVDGAGIPPKRESGDTTHFSVVAPDGGAVSLTTTINTGYGCKVVVSGAGFLLNNEMDDFSAKPGAPNTYGVIGGEANSIQPGKRMLSSMTPTLVVHDGQLRLVVGTPGGSRIITSVLQVVVNIVDHEMSVSDAVDAGRIHHQWKPEVLQTERRALSPDTRQRLEAMGWKMRRMSTFCSVQAILRQADGGLRGFGDLRRGGHASGF